MHTTYAPLRTLRDIEELERVPLDQRIFLESERLDRPRLRRSRESAIRYRRRRSDSDRSPSPMPSWAQRQPGGQPVPLARRVVARRVLYILPTVRSSTYHAGRLACGIACGVNWMLEPAHLAELVRATRPKVIVTLGPTQGYKIWENLQAIERTFHLCTSSPCRARAAAIPESDLDTLAVRQSGDRLHFDRKVASDDIAAYVHSGGTTGSPKLVQLTHRGFAYRCWARRGRHGAHVKRCDLRRLSHVPYRRHLRARLFRRRAWHVDRHPHAARRATSASSRITGNSCRGSASRSSPACRPPGTACQERPRGEALGTLRDYARTGSTAFPAEVARQIEA